MMIHLGNAMFTRDTDDIESKGKFYHRYVDGNFKLCGCGSNGNIGNAVNLYVKTMKYEIGSKFKYE